MKRISKALLLTVVATIVCSSPMLASNPAPAVWIDSPEDNDATNALSVVVIVGFQAYEDPLTGGVGDVMDIDLFMNGQLLETRSNDPSVKRGSMEFLVDLSGLPDQVIDFTAHAYEGNDRAGLMGVSPASRLVLDRTPDVILLQRDSPDSMVDYFRNLLRDEEIATTVMSCADFENLNPSPSIIIAGFDDEPAECVGAPAAAIARAVERGSWLLAESYARYLLDYSGIGQVRIGSWVPAVADKVAYVDKISDSFVFDGLAAWNPPETPDLSGQYLWDLAYPIPIVGCDYIPPASGVDHLEFWKLYITYGWAAQPTDSEYCTTIWSGCTPERSVHREEVTLVHAPA